jgi:hypothetical protein
MSDETGTANPNGNPEGGSPGGSAGGQQGSGSDEVQSQLAAAEERRRHFQGLADQREARIMKLEAELTSVEELKAELDAMKGLVQGSQAQSVDVDLLASRVAEQLAAAQTANEWKLQVAQRYPGVDMKAVKGASLEEIEGAAKAQYDSQQAAEKAIRDKVEAEVRGKYAAHFGNLDDFNSDVQDQGDKGTAQGGVVTVEQFVNMTPEQEAKLPPDVWNRLIREMHAKESAE